MREPGWRTSGSAVGDRGEVWAVGCVRLSIAGAERNPAVWAVESWVGECRAELKKGGGGNVTSR
jgi:hypothetical protein